MFLTDLLLNRLSFLPIGRDRVVSDVSMSIEKLVKVKVNLLHSSLTPRYRITHRYHEEYGHT